MRIIQLTDIHIGEEGEDTFNADVRGNFLKALKWAKSVSPDHLVISGDFCFLDPRPGIYEWISSKLQDFPCPVWFTSGNHDQTEMMAKTFGLEHLLQGNELYYVATLGEVEFIFLDTSSYTLPETQLKWLKGLLEKSKGPRFVFMHHPPSLMGMPFMDRKYPLRNWAAAREVFLSCPDEVYVFSGHYHIDRSLSLNNLHIFVTPSTFFQIDQYSTDFRVDHFRIGLRELTWNENEFQTSVRYIDP